MNTYYIQFNFNVNLILPSTVTDKNIIFSNLYTTIRCIVLENIGKNRMTGYEIIVTDIKYRHPFLGLVLFSVGHDDKLNQMPFLVDRNIILLNVDNGKTQSTVIQFVH